ncbi:SLAC1 anion channel family protein [Polaromonas sp. YR568]|uniref:SLAC1 anion channel family protein n=1 Tax=Polaromonas sp. YR568 TaxID=1855301 RepID=UPI00398BE555
MNTLTAPNAPAPASAAFAAGPYSLRQLPINLYGAVMGLAGMALAWRLAVPVFGAPAAIGEAMGFFALAVFLAHSAGYLAKLALHPEAVRKEFTDPVSGNFFGQFAISLLLLSCVLMPYGQAFSQGLWTAGVVVTLALSVLVGSRLLKGKLAPAHMLPVWIIPGVGVLDIGVTGGHLPMAWAGEINLLAMAVGAMVALVLWTLIIHRLAHGEPLPQGMRPSLMILMAPFAVGFLAWVNVFGEVDRFAGALFYFALFVFIVVSPKVFRRDVPFSPGWWAISFPMAALANAAIVYAGARGGLVLHVLAALLLGLLTAALAVLTVRTLHWVFSGRLFATA